MSIISAVLARRIFDGEKWHEDHAVIIEDGKVREIVAWNALTASIHVEEAVEGFLAPGFVDLQVNGGGGVLLNNDPSVEGIRAICAAHGQLGTTALLPTLITDTPEVTATAIDAAIAAFETKVPGFAGLHLEGPHLSRARKGAHDPALIHPMSDEEMAKLIAAKQQLPILLTTVAAESITPQQVRELVSNGITVSIGHSDASHSDVLALVDAGANMVTHLFNAMSQMSGREPGVVGAALSSGKLYAGLIADGHHVHPTNIQTALRAKAGPGRIFLVTDAMSSVGSDLTQFTLNGRTIYRSGGKLTLEDGTLAGADIDMAASIHVMCKQVGISLGEALRMASLYPAEAIGLAQAGRIAPGHPANLAWLDDSVGVKQTWIDGERTGSKVTG